MGLIFKDNEYGSDSDQDFLSNPLLNNEKRLGKTLKGRELLKKLRWDREWKSAKKIAIGIDKMIEEK